MINVRRLTQIPRILDDHLRPPRLVRLVERLLIALRGRDLVQQYRVDARVLQIRAVAERLVCGRRKIYDDDEGDPPEILDPSRLARILQMVIDPTKEKLVCGELEQVRQLLAEFFFSDAKSVVLVLVSKHTKRNTHPGSNNLTNSGCSLRLI